MNYKIVEEKHIGLGDLSLYGLVLKILRWSPSEWNSAELCTYVHDELPFLLHIRGKFADIEHSWLLIKDSHVIIDVYPIACATPMLLCVNQDPWNKLYEVHL